MKKNKKSLRLLITEKCDLNCEYCCNKLDKVRRKFEYKNVSDIDFKQYSCVCITGGEPLLEPVMLGYVKEACRSIKIPLYLYTNGLSLSKGFPFPEFSGISISIHESWQMMFILDSIPEILTFDNIRFMVEDVKRHLYLQNIPGKYIRTWHRDDCFNNFETEDFVVLK